MAKIAVELQRAVQERRLAGIGGNATARILAQGDDWRVADVICTSGPDDHPFEEQHSGVAIAIVAAGTFQYRATSHRDLLTPGAFLLGSPGQSYECAHEHGAGDRCVSFHYTADFFSRVTASHPRFRLQRLPPLRASAALTARACAVIAGAHDGGAYEELAVNVAAQTVQLANDVSCDNAPVLPNVAARVTRVVRAIDRHPEAALSLQHLAKSAGLSPYHFLRTFTQITGTTPHQYALRTRLREAALRLATDHARVIDIALDCGFGDVSNFNRSFRAEFGESPRRYRQRARASHQRERRPLRRRQSLADRGELREP